MLNRKLWPFFTNSCFIPQPLTAPPYLAQAACELALVTRHHVLARRVAYTGFEAIQLLRRRARQTNRTRGLQHQTEVCRPRLRLCRRVAVRVGRRTLLGGGGVRGGDDNLLVL